MYSIVIGLMTAFDMGGPVNKFASTFTMALMTAGVYGLTAHSVLQLLFLHWSAVLHLLCSPVSLVTLVSTMGISAVFIGLIVITEAQSLCC